MRFIHSMLGVVAALAVAASAYANDGRVAQVTVVTDSKHPVYNAPLDAKEILLDVSEQLLQKLSENLPDDPNHAQAIAMERLREGGGEFQGQMQLAAQGVVDAWRLQVSKIPAVVVNKKYVVYGESNINLAIEQIKRYLNNEIGVQND